MFNLPQVTEDNNLIFDSRGPVPESIPYFEKVGPTEFRPTFQDCVHRTLKTVKLSALPTCVRTRQIWWCNHYNTDVFPKTCADCELTDASAETDSSAEWESFVRTTVSEASDRLP